MRVNAVPVAVDDPNAATNAGTAVVISVLANDSDADGTLVANTVAVGTQASSGTAVANADGTITYTPNGGFSGTDTFTYTVMDNDGATSNVATVTVTVNAFPIATDDPGIVTQLNTAVIVSVLANDSDSDGTLDITSVAIVGGQGPLNGIAVANADGTITYTPTNGFTGNDTFQYTVLDNLGAISNAATVSTRVNAPPVAVDDLDIQIPPGAANAVISVLVNDSDSDGNMMLLPGSIVITTQGTNGTATANPNGTITYTPTIGFTGNDSFQYTVMDDDGGTSNVATVTIAINTAPLAVNDSGTVDEDMSINIDLAMNDSDPDGTLVLGTVSLFGAGPSNGAAVFNNDGTVTYTPNQHFSGTDTFEYTILDNDKGRSNAAMVTVTVTPVADAPTLDRGETRLVAKARRWTLPIMGSLVDLDGSETTLGSTKRPANDGNGGSTGWEPDREHFLYDPRI